MMVKRFPPINLGGNIIFIYVFIGGAGAEKYWLATKGIY